ncbi:NUDIX domain-containing protein [Roseococcus suduntuyensis]|uniref:ADP-ribose pyrophosphatase n=1 Tax=Roseococcus suduntuyensis TaxID=455361 RepID=A0A840AAC8_9PROT|nr:NUDIX domain-containing protein [Roseococcus suduntuyensis]MBB3898057.1 ADP-ribose pyrophosphatase [Roseococcus suduntuyensis]
MTARPPKAPPIPAHPGLDVRTDELVWSGRFPLQRVVFTYTRFDGTPSRELIWELWRRGQGVALLPYDPWADRVALIEQFRLPILAAGYPPIETECVAGLLEAGEDPAEAARRETQEEAGLDPDRIEKIGRYFLMQGGCDEMMHLYCGRARLPEPGAGATHGLAAEGEDIRLLVLTAEEALARLDANTITNATAALCLHWLRQHRARLRQDWTTA